jgi:hypothetical protein
MTFPRASDQLQQRVEPFRFKLDLQKKCGKFIVSQSRPSISLASNTCGGQIISDIGLLPFSFIGGG